MRDVASVADNNKQFKNHGRLAQLVERFIYTEDVGGSSPPSPTEKAALKGGFLNYGHTYAVTPPPGNTAVTCLDAPVLSAHHATTAPFADARNGTHAAQAVKSS